MGSEEAVCVRGAAGPANALKVAAFEGAQPGLFAGGFLNGEISPQYSIHQVLR
jgi:hypothetical protein